VRTIRMQCIIENMHNVPALGWLVVEFRDKYPICKVDKIVGPSDILKSLRAS
jgi:hypothetical protein